MRTVAIGLALGLLAALASVPGVAQDGSGTWYAERISSGSAPVRVEHFWSKGPWLRSETVFSGHPILTLVKGERYVIVDRLTGKGLSIQRSPKAIAQDAGRKRPFGNELGELKAAGGEQVGAEKVGAVACDLYRLTDEGGRREVCVSQDEERLPVFVRVWIRGTGASTESRYLQWSRELEIPDAFFEPPADAAIEHIGYEEYVRRAPNETLGPAPPFHADLLHGE